MYHKCDVRIPLTIPGTGVIRLLIHQRCLSNRITLFFTVQIKKAGTPYKRSVDCFFYEPLKSTLFRQPLFVYIRVGRSAKDVVYTHPIKVRKNKQRFCWWHTLAGFKLGKQCLFNARSHLECHLCVTPADSQLF